MPKLKVPKLDEVKTWGDFVKEVLGITNGNLPNQISAQTARNASKNSFIAVFCEKGIVVNCSSEPRIADYERGDDYFAVAVIYHARKALSVPGIKSEDLLDPARIGTFAVEIQAAATAAVKKIDQEPWYKKKAGRKENINNFSKWVSDWKDENPISVDSPKNDDDDGGSDKKTEDSEKNRSKTKRINIKKFKPKITYLLGSDDDDNGEGSGKKSENSKEGPSASGNESKSTKEETISMKKSKSTVEAGNSSKADDDTDEDQDKLDKEEEESSSSEKIKKGKPEAETQSSGDNDVTTSNSQAQSQSKENDQNEKVTYNIQIGEDPVTTLTLDENATIQDAKAKIAKENDDVDPIRVKILFAGKTLKNGLLMKNLHLDDKDVLQVFIQNIKDVFLGTAKALRIDDQQDAEEYYSDY